MTGGLIVGIVGILASAILLGFGAFLLYADAQNIEIHWITPRKLRKKRNAITYAKLEMQHETLKAKRAQIQEEMLKRMLNSGGEEY